MKASHHLIHKAFQRHTETVERSMASLVPSVQAGADILVRVAVAGGRLFTCGNGGSAADSQHLAAEWMCRYAGDRPPLAAIALTTDTSALTAISNDYDFSHVFARKIHALGARNDVVVAFSTSGTSKNVLAAMHTARQKRMRVILLTGEGGKRAAARADVAIVVPSRETARIQEVHQIVYHIWCEMVDARYTPREKFVVRIS